MSAGSRIDGLRGYILARGGPRRRNAKSAIPRKWAAAAVAGLDVWCPCASRHGDAMCAARVPIRCARTLKADGVDGLQVDVRSLPDVVQQRRLAPQPLLLRARCRHDLQLACQRGRHVALTRRLASSSPGSEPVTAPNGLRAGGGRVACAPFAAAQCVRPSSTAALLCCLARKFAYRARRRRVRQSICASKS